MKKYLNYTIDLLHLMKDFQLSEVETQILSLLRQDARTSYKVIAQKTGVAISTVHNTVKRLVEKGVIKNFSLKLDSQKIGYDLTVVIGILTTQGSLQEVEQRLVQHPNVCQVFIVTGEYDLIVVAKFANTNELNDFIRDFLQKTVGAARTNTSVVLSAPKERLYPALDENLDIL